MQITCTHIYIREIYISLLSDPTFTMPQGIPNLGSTCFAGAVVQAMLSQEEACETGIVWSLQV
jgi:hypothetical protein